MFSSIQNVKFIAFIMAFWGFFGFFVLLRPKSKIENNHLFAKKKSKVFLSLCKMMNQNLKFFKIKKELNAPLVPHGM
jgi:hypothetical protein